MDGPAAQPDVGPVAPPTLDQLALASMIGSGAFDRHLRACRHRYRRRRDALVGLLATALPTAEVTGVAAGLHLVLNLGDGTDAGAVVRAAAARSVWVVALADYHATPDLAGPGLVVGYGNLADSAVGAAVTELVAAIRGSSPADR